MKAIKVLPVIIYILLCLTKSIFAQNVIDLPYIEQAPTIDGVMNEAVWNRAATFTNFKTMKPTLDLNPSQKTIVKMYYNSLYIFVGIICYDTNPSKIKASLASRDNALGDDFAAFALDTFNDNLSAYYFASNPLGIQNDGTLDSDGNPDGTPDFIWQCSAKESSDGYTVEFAIPFESLRFPNNKNLIMGLKVARQITRLSEEDDFPGYYPNKGAALAQFQKIRINGSRINVKKILEFIPDYTLSQSYQINNGTLQKLGTENNFGFTSKVGLTSDITMDATYNPDFSQIETDAGQIDVNLRYSIYYPEKRPFFLEGKDMLGFAGQSVNYPLGQIVNTRSIVKPKLGVKITGRAFSSDKFYFLYALDDYPGEYASQNNIPDLSNKVANFSVFRYVKTFSSDSYIGAIFTGKNFADEYNYVTGIDGRMRLNGVSVIEYNLFGSFTKQHLSSILNKGSVASFNYDYSTDNIQASAGIYNFSKNFDTQVGYLTRTGISTVPLFFQYRFNLNKKWLYKIEANYNASHSIDRFSNLYEGQNLFTVSFSMPYQSVLSLSLAKSNEIYSNKSFNKDSYSVDFYIQPKIFYFSVNLVSGKAILYDPVNPQQGRGKQLSSEFTLQQTSHFKTSLYVLYADLYSVTNGNKFYDETVYQSNTTFHLNEYFYFRAILEYNDYQKQFDENLLAAFSYIPGTVIYLGYGSSYQKLIWENEHYSPSNDFLMTQKTFYFKASYLYRF